MPAYVVFHDRVLYAIARARPRTPAALGEVPGVSASKLRAFGQEILSAVRIAA